MKLSSPSLAALAVLGTALLAPLAPAHAALVQYSFTVTPDDAVVAPGTGSFSFDDAQVPGTSAFGEDLFALSAFNFSFAGGSYLLADMDYADAVFSRGQFLGLDAVLGSLFSLVPGTTLPDAFFAYELQGQGAFGSVAYRLDTGGGGQIPEPASAWLALLGLLPLAGATRRRARAQCKVVQNPLNQ